MGVEADSFRCLECLERYCDSAGVIEAPRPSGPHPEGRSWRSNGAAPDGLGWPYLEEGGEEIMLDICPLPQVPEWWPRLLQQFHLYERGNLLRSGGVAAQPRRYLRLMAYIQSTKQEFLDRRRARTEAARKEV